MQETKQAPRNHEGTPGLDLAKTSKLPLETMHKEGKENQRSLSKSSS